MSQVANSTRMVGALLSSIRGVPRMRTKFSVRPLALRSIRAGVRTHAVPGSAAVRPVPATITSGIHLSTGARMRLAVFLQPAGAVEVAREAERLGCTMALAPEGFRADAASVLGAVAATTSTIGLGTGVMQIPGRSPVLTALTAATLDGLSGGRFHLGLGVSNADVSRGWYGVDFDRPLERTREYVQIVRAALSGGPVRHRGRHYQLPPPGCTEA